MDVYKKWVRTNKEYVHTLDSLANGLTWLLPERFWDSEIGPEAVSAILGIITAVNEHIIDTTPTKTHAGAPESHSFPYPFCISAIKNLETLVEVAAQHYYGDDKKWNFIAVTEAIKVLVRLSLFRNSGYKMLLHGGETPNTEKRQDFSCSGGFPRPGSLHGPDHFHFKNGQIPWNLEGRALSALSRFGENARMVSEPVWLYSFQHQHTMMEPPTSDSLVEKAKLSALLSKHTIMEPPTPAPLVEKTKLFTLLSKYTMIEPPTPLVEKTKLSTLLSKHTMMEPPTPLVEKTKLFTLLSKHNMMEPPTPTPLVERTKLSTLLSKHSIHGALFVMGEVLLITRPLIYVLLIRKYGIRSWIPWFLSLAMDFIGIDFLTQVAKSNHGGKEQQFHLTSSEKDELKRRKLLWALYLMRDPFFSKYSRQRLEGAGKILEPVPIIGFLTEKIVELIISAQTRFTYMSGS